MTSSLASRADPGHLKVPESAEAEQPKTTSAWNVVIAGAASSIIAISAYGNGDPDLYWHRVLGGVWWRQLSLQLPSPDPISYTSGKAWQSTSWAVDVLYDRIVTAAGYDGIGVLRLVLSSALAVLLVRFITSLLPAMRSGLLLAAVGIPAALTIQDRPQSFSYVFAAAMLPALHRWYTAQQVPGIKAVFLFTWLWANVHGLWVLVPALLGIIALTDLFSPGTRRKSLGLFAASVVAGVATPIGPALLVAPFRLHGATEQISEWEPTSLQFPFTWGFASCLALILVGWAKRAKALPNYQIVFVLLVAAFGMSAYRNVVISSLLLLPPTVDILKDVLPQWRSNIVVPRIVVAVGAVLLISLGAGAFLREPVIPGSNPNRIATALAKYQSPVRVVNDYNISGYLREFGGPGVRLAIDGRADRYGAKTIRRYGDMLDGVRGWQARLARYEPDVVVINRLSPLRELLTERGWTTDLADGSYVMLSKPK